MTLARLLFPVLLGLARAEPGFDAEIARQKEELAAIKSRLEAERKAVQALKQERSGARDRLDKITLGLELAEKYLRKLSDAEETLRRSVESTREELQEVEERIADRRSVISRRVRTLFMKGRPDEMFLFGWKPGRGDFLKRAYFTRRLLDYDRGLVRASERDAASKRAHLEDLDAKITELAAVSSAKTEELKAHSEAKREQERVFAELQSSVRSKSRALREMEENARRLTEIIRELEKRRREQLARRKTPSVLATRDKYCLPVEGEIVSRYGLQFHKVLKTTTKNLGIEIAGAPGAAVRAAVSGEVALITEIPGYGPGIILDNGSNFYTIYANLAGIRVQQGERVNTCQDIAGVPAGQPQGRVYFEVRDGTRTLDPMEWLKR